MNSSRFGSKMQMQFIRNAFFHPPLIVHHSASIFTHRKIEKASTMTCWEYERLKTLRTLLFHFQFFSWGKKKKRIFFSIFLAAPRNRQERWNGSMQGIVCICSYWTLKTGMPLKLLHKICIKKTCRKVTCDWGGSPIRSK